MLVCIRPLLFSKAWSGHHIYARVDFHENTNSNDLLLLSTVRRQVASLNHLPVFRPPMPYTKRTTSYAKPGRTETSRKTILQLLMQNTIMYITTRETHFELGNR